MGTISDKNKPDDGASRGPTCTSCGGELQRTTRTEGTGDSERSVPLAKCISCGKEYGRDTAVYYGFFAGVFSAGREDTMLRLWLTGILNGLDCQITGRIRYQDEAMAEPSARDEWIVMSGGDTYHRLIEESGEIYFFPEYRERTFSIDETLPGIELEGSTPRKMSARRAHVVFSEGRLPRKLTIGEPYDWYEFKRGGSHFVLEKAVDGYKLHRGRRVSLKKIMGSFLKDAYLPQYENTVAGRREYRRIALLYLVMALVAGALTLRAYLSGHPAEGVMSRRAVIPGNEFTTGNDRTVRSRVMYGPVELGREAGLCEITLTADGKLQAPRYSSRSFRVMLIKEDRLDAGIRSIVKELQAGKAVLWPAQKADLNSYFDDINLQPEPVESYEYHGDFRDGAGYGGRTGRHEINRRVIRDFVPDRPGQFYIYTEISGEQPGNAGLYVVSVRSGVKSCRYHIFAMVLFIVLMLYFRHKAVIYNELPFPFSAYRVE